ncbi:MULTISPECIES: CDP-glucose 4,6-dehydratase [unclassified Thiocapsa]|uniref:CDP-glucose 4,6-dehydratase n=1 Tax=unclassified Thiocapsa TaxID=2641286 RepID=UPI0035AE36F0
MRTSASQLTHAYQGKTVLITGHTGFKGAWLSEWLLMLGARVVGIALAPNTEPALFDQLGLAERLEHHILDIRDREALAARVQDTAPDYIFHLAAQALVRQSYIEPVETYATNVMGTLHVLDALRVLDQRYSAEARTCASVFITTDKCYENREWVHGYRETDALGGYDPYSSSKAAAELAIAAYRSSYFNPAMANQTAGRALRIGIASARAGNVIGGGDWARDRIVPDSIRHLRAGEPIAVRNPHATRPWQHVLEPLSGYLQLAALQRQALDSGDRDLLNTTCSAYNFGPALSANQPVGALVERILSHWPGQWRNHADPSAPHEAGLLNLVWDKAFHRLCWQPRWDFAETIGRTVDWYRQQLTEQADPLSLVRADILAYQAQCTGSPS